ncbi:MAG: hypothetical protein SGJ24_12655 [Chloroflexota bacterium]|nr:hypothetical protein [Chloroflexota bacterium]
MTLGTINRAGRPDLARLLRAIAAVPPQDELADTSQLVRALSGGRPLSLMLPELIDPDRADAPHPALVYLGAFGEIDGVSVADDADDADIALVLHLSGADPTVTALQVEAAITAGHRTALVDVSQGADRADPALLPALANTTVYIGNLAAYDVDINRAIAAVMTPIRDGTAHRRYLALTMVYYWAWRGIVESEVLAAFGESIPPHKMLRATTQARSRLGAELLKVRGRGLPYVIRTIGFDGGRVDGFWVDLASDS